MPPAELLGKDRFAEKKRAADKKEQQEEDGDTKPDVLYADDPGCIHRAPRFAGNVRKRESRGLLSDRLCQKSLRALVGCEQPVMRRFLIFHALIQNDL